MTDPLNTGTSTETATETGTSAVPTSDTRTRSTTGPSAAVDPDDHPAHVEEWRDDAAASNDMDREAVIDEIAPTVVESDRGDALVVPDDDRPVVFPDDDRDDGDGDADAPDAVSLDDPDEY